MTDRFIFGPPPSEEEQARMQAEYEKRQMQGEAFRNEVQEFLDELPPRHAYIVKTLVETAAHDDDWAHRVVGELIGKMRWKDKVDPRTGHPEGSEFFADIKINED